MRRSVVACALLAVCVLGAAPASVQVQNHSRFATAGIGPAFGTLGSTPVVDASAGYNLTKHVRQWASPRSDRGDGSRAAADRRAYLRSRTSSKSAAWRRVQQAASRRRA